MNTGGDAAEQVVRLSLDGVEVAARLTGSAAKNMAVLIYTILKDYDTHKTKGKMRMAAMLKSGKPLTVFGVRAQDMRTFVQAARNYGVSYCVVKAPGKAGNDLTDVLVYQSDAARIDRIVSRFGLAVTENTMEKPKEEDEKIKNEKALSDTVSRTSEPLSMEAVFGKHEKDSEKSLPEEIIISSAGESLMAKPKAASNPSEPFLKTPGHDGFKRKPSIRETLQRLEAQHGNKRPENMPSPVKKDMGKERRR